jgi:hypothetical protein
LVRELLDVPFDQVYAYVAAPPDAMAVAAPVSLEQVSGSLRVVRVGLLLTVRLMERTLSQPFTVVRVAE